MKNNTMNSYVSFRLYPGIYKKLPPSDVCILIVLTGVLCIQLFFLLFKINTLFLYETTIRHGEIHEGIVGVPAYRNPLYAVNAAEKDLASLMHAGLLKYDNAGNFVPHIAETWTKDDSHQYTFTLRENAVFHDGTPITTEDVVHTVMMIQQEQKYKNPYFDVWSDVEVAAEDSMTVTIAVPESNLHFPEHFTIPILPKHVWKKIPKDKQRNYNGPGVYVGAGPFKYDRETVTLDERPTSITLAGFSEYVLGYPFIKKITLHFFVDINNLLEAYEMGIIDGIHSVTAIEVPILLKQRREGRDALYTARTNRVFGAFFNTEDGRILQDSFLRSVLSQWVKRNQIVTDIFNGHATAIQSPIATDTIIEERDIALEDLEKTLEDIGWEFEATTGQREKDGVPLSILFVLPDVEETKDIANILIKGWRRIGVTVEVQIVPEASMAAVIEEKNFDVILYGYKVNTVKDIVALWKSGDTKNLAAITSFGSPTLNDLLTDLESSSPPERLIDQLSQPYDDNWRDMVYNEIKIEMIKNVPAIFLYSPHFLYILPEVIQGVDLDGTRRLGRVLGPSGRFITVHTWYLKKEKVWKFLVEK